MLRTSLVLTLNEYSYSEIEQAKEILLNLMINMAMVRCNTCKNYIGIIIGVEMRILSIIMFVFIAVACCSLGFLVVENIQVLLGDVADDKQVMLSSVLVLINLLGVAVTLFYAYHMFINPNVNSIGHIRIEAQRNALKKLIRNLTFQAKG